MAKCKDCKNSCYLLDEYDKPYFWCNVFEDNFNEERKCLCIAYRPKTNADRIRSMTDEQLAKHFSDLIKDAQEYEYCEDVSDWLKWLQQEIK